MKTTKADKEKAIADLRELLKPGDTVYTILRHRARSGMSRVIDVQVIQDNEPRRIGFLAAKATGYGYDDRHEGVKMSGAGMDMGFALVYALSHTLYPGGFGCIGKGEGHGNGCPSNDHRNGDRDYTPHDTGDTRWTPGSDYKAPHHHWHASGGYALRHRWL